MKILIICSVLFFAAGATAMGQKTSTSDPCSDAQTQFEMSQCAHKEYAKSDAALNVTYKKLMAALKENGEKYQEKLKDAQLQWIKYRDTTCESESQLNEGGTMYPMVYNFCLASVTDERNKRLKAQLTTMTQ